MRESEMEMRGKIERGRIGNSKNRVKYFRNLLTLRARKESANIEGFLKSRMPYFCGFSTMGEN